MEVTTIYGHLLLYYYYYTLYRLTGSTTRCLNLGSYNYLGFAETEGPCADASIEATYEYGAGNNSPRRDLG